MVIELETSRTSTTSTASVHTAASAKPASGKEPASRPGSASPSASVSASASPSPAGASSPAPGEQPAAPRDARTERTEFARVADAAIDLAPGSEPHFGLVAFVDDWAFDRTGAAEGGIVHLGAETLRAAFGDLRRTYTDANRNPGDGPDGPTLQNPICEENALDALHAAATEFPWRDPSTRVAILVTDDTFLERPDNYGDRDGDGETDRQDFPREGDYPAETTVAETVSALRDRLVRVFSFTRLAPPSIFDFTRCGTGRRLPWEDISDGWSTPYGEHAPIPDQTDGGNLDLDQVLSGQVSLADAITELVAESYCDPVDLF